MVVVVYGCGQLLESLYLTPRLVGERIGLHPLAVIFALLAFGQLFGFVGVLVALPLPVPCCWWPFGASGRLSLQPPVPGLKVTRMKQIALDIGLSTGPTIANFCAGPMKLPCAIMELWIGSKANAADSLTRSPVPPTCGAPGSGKSHLLKAAREGLRDQGARVGWLDASVFDAHPNSANPGRRSCWTMCTSTPPCSSTPHSTGLSMRRPTSAGCWLRAIAPGWICNCATTCGPAWAGAMCFHLQVLSEPERRAVLRQAADARGVFLGDEVMDFMLTRFSRDLGSLMELLDLIDGYALQTKRAITIPLIKSMMDNN
jgi:DnaA family protein